MKDDKTTKLYNSITDIDEKYIEEASSTNIKKKCQRYGYMKLAACFCLIVAVGIFVKLNVGGNAQAPGSSSGGSGHGEGSIFMSYDGPVFPLTALGGTDGIETTRNINYDFSPYSSDSSAYEVYGVNGRSSIVTDDYILTNTAAEDKTITLAYPYASNLQSGLKPSITIDGQDVATKLYCGMYSGDFRGAGDENSSSLNLENISSWEGYKALLENGKYIDEAFSDYPSLDENVIVYELSDITDGGSNAVNPTLNIEFNMNYDKTIILTYGFNGGRYDPDTGHTARNFSIPKNNERDYGQSRYIIVLGDDIGEYLIQGYQNGGCEPNEKITGASAHVTRYEATLGEMLRIIAKYHYDDCVNSAFDGDHNRYIDGGITFDTYYGEVVRFFAKYGVTGNEAKERYQFGALEDIINETAYHDRIMYMTFDVTIPAGQSVNVSSILVKNGSFDFSCTGSENKGIEGYDMVTLLGSNLSFVEQTASIEDHGLIEIVRQNFGFDLDNNIKSVKLDVENEHYYIEVRRIDK